MDSFLKVAIINRDSYFCIVNKERRYDIKRANKRGDI